MTTTNQASTDPDAQCPTHGCARWRCDADHPATADLELCLSPTGWSLHAPGSTDEQIRDGDRPPLASGDGRPTAEDYRRAHATLAAAGGR